MNGLAWALVASVAILTPAEAVGISSCGQTVPPGEVGVLQADLVCPSVIGVHLGPGATLDMNGHSISAGPVGVRCDRSRCGIVGPGEITGASGCAIDSALGVPIFIFATDLQLHDNGCGIGAGSPHEVTVRRVTIRANKGDGITGPRPDGAGHIHTFDTLITGNGGIGVFAQRFRLFASTVQGNGGIGVVSLRAFGALRTGASVTGNDSANGIDLATHKKPHILDGTCGRSAMVDDSFTVNPATTWHVCAGD